MNPRTVCACHVLSMSLPLMPRAEYRRYVCLAPRYRDCVRHARDSNSGKDHICMYMSGYVYACLCLYKSFAALAFLSSAGCSSVTVCACTCLELRPPSIHLHCRAQPRPIPLRTILWDAYSAQLFDHDILTYDYLERIFHAIYATDIHT